MNPDLRRFIKRYLKEIYADNAAVFAGAGLSIDAGYVSWGKLLAEEAAELNLKLHRHSDLAALAQFYVNSRGGNRNRLSEKIYNLGVANPTPTRNHRILARLPISTYWTVNYDPLIERALAEARKVADVKFNPANFRLSKSPRDAVVYKMHGDQSDPENTVLVRAEFEVY